MMSNTETKQENIVAKIEAMLRLANDAKATVAEAESALLMAQRMAAKHHINMAALSGEAKVEEGLSTCLVGTVLLKASYRKLLLNVICRNFRSEFFFLLEPTTNEIIEARIIGYYDDVATITKLFQFAITVAENELLRYLLGNERMIGNSVPQRTKVREQWCHGFVLGIEAKFKAQVAEVPGMALMVITPQPLKDLMAEMNPNMAHIDTPDEQSYHTYHGYMTGLNMGDPNDGLITEG